MSTNNAYIKPLYITQAQAAAILSCQPGTVSKLIKQGLLPTRREEGVNDKAQDD